MKPTDITREEIFKYAKEKFGTNPEYLWLKSPKNAILRNNENSKWYAAVLYVQKRQLGLAGEEYIDILDVKCDAILIGSLLNNNGYLPGYHMNKSNWITLLLDGSVPKDDVFNLIALSYELTANKKK